MQKFLVGKSTHFTLCNGLLTFNAVSETNDDIRFVFSGKTGFFCCIAALEFRYNL